MPPTHFRTAAAFTRQGRGGLAEVPQGRGFAELWPRCGLGSLSSRVLALTRANPAFIRAPAAGAEWTHAAGACAPCGGFGGAMRLPESCVGILLWTHTLPGELRCVQGAPGCACSNMESTGPAVHQEGSTSDLSSGDPAAGNPWLWCSSSSSALLCECFSGIKLPQRCRQCRFTTTECTAPALAS